MRSRRTHETKPTIPTVHTHDTASGRDEMNLVEFPLTLLTERASEGQTTLRYTDEISENGKTVRREVIVTGSPEWGLPTAKDEDVLVGLLQLTKAKNEFTDATVAFTRLDLITLLGWPNHHWSYSRLAQSFARWQGVSIHYHKAWRNNRDREWTSRLGFGLIDSFELTDARRAGTRHVVGEGKSWFRWNGYLFDSFRSGYLKKLNYAVYKGLDSQIAKRLYRYLDKQFYGPGRQRLVFDLRTLACEHLGLSRTYDAAQIKRKLAPALDELAAVGFLQPMPPDERYRKVRWGQWSITVARKPPDLVPTTVVPAEPPRPSHPEDDILARLSLLPTTERERFERDAVAAAASFWAENYRNARSHGGPLFDTTRRKILADHFARTGR